MNRDRGIRATVRDVDASVHRQRHLLRFAEARRDLRDRRHVAIGIGVEPQEFALARALHFGTRHDVDRAIVIEGHSAGDIETGVYCGDLAGRWHARRNDGDGSDVAVCPRRKFEHRRGIRGPPRSAT